MKKKKKKCKSRGKGNIYSPGKATVLACKARRRLPDWEFGFDK
jgi:hypothetical protein